MQLKVAVISDLFALRLFTSVHFLSSHNHERADTDLPVDGFPFTNAVKMSGPAPDFKLSATLKGHQSDV